MKLLLTLSLLVASAASAHATCTAEVGAARANRYVQQCREVSPATHPPCNATNACALITGEIRRGCQFLGNDAPAFCREYRQ